MPATTIQLGALTLTIAQLTLGQLKRVRAEMQVLLTMRKQAEEMPTVEQLDAMVAVLHASASASDAALTREAITEAVDAQPFDVGMKQLADAIGTVMLGSGLTARTGSTVTGEAESPATDS